MKLRKLFYLLLTCFFCSVSGKLRRRQLSIMAGFFGHISKKFLKDGSLVRMFRFEQRFLDHQNDNSFAQRLRYYVRAQIPLLTNPLFTKGLYLSVQNELFLNVQGKEQVNNHIFDQNRSYTGPGYRFSENLDMEIGYMIRYQIDKEANLRNNILQIVIKTSF